MVQKPSFLLSEVDSDCTLLERMKLVQQEDHFLDFYTRKIRCWGWITSCRDRNQLSINKIEVSNNADHDVGNIDQRENVREIVQYNIDEFIYYLLFKMRAVEMPRGSKESREQYRRFLRTSLFWSITAAIGGILGYCALIHKSTIPN